MKQRMSFKKLLLTHKPVLFIVLFGIVGSVIILFAYAATSSNLIEPELNTLSGNVSTVDDTSASIGRYLLFQACPSGQNGIPPNCVTPVGNFVGNNGTDSTCIFSKAILPFQQAFCEST